MKAVQGMVVSMHYTLTDENGEVLDSSRGGEPFNYLHGHRNIIPGLERAIEGAEAGFKSKLMVVPADGYGEKNPEAVFEAPREHFPPEMKLDVGARVYADGPNGPITLTVVKMTDTGAVLDANHPLAGKTLHFDVEISTVRAATGEEIEHGHVHGKDDHSH